MMISALISQWHSIGVHFRGLFDKRIGRSRSPRDEYTLQGSEPGPMSDADSDPRPSGDVSRRYEPLTAALVTSAQAVAGEKRALEAALRRDGFSRPEATRIVAIVAQWARDTELHTPPNPH
jgi:hypothetical protein